MTTTIPVAEVTLRTLKQTLNLQPAIDRQFFFEWQGDLDPIDPSEQLALDRVKDNFLDLLEEPPALENSVKMVVLGPLLDLAGFYRRPFRIATEASIAIDLDDEGLVIRGRIDILVLNQMLWLVAIESKRSDFAVARALPQTLTYLLGNPERERATFGLITNGTDFLFLKAQRNPLTQYATSRLFSLFNPGNELHSVLAILKSLAKAERA